MFFCLLSFSFRFIFSLEFSIMNERRTLLGLICSGISMVLICLADVGTSAVPNTMVSSSELSRLDCDRLRVLD